MPMQDGPLATWGALHLPAHRGRASLYAARRKRIKEVTREQVCWHSRRAGHMR